MFREFFQFLQMENVQLRWYSNALQLLNVIDHNNPELLWYCLVLMEAMTFKPYFPLSMKTDKKGNQVPGRKQRLEI